MKKSHLKPFLFWIILNCLFLKVSTAAYAAGTGMPWESTLSKITNSLTGPVAKSIGVLMIMFTSFGWAKSEHGEMIRNFFAICIALSVAFTAGTVLIPMLGFSGGVGF